MVASFIEVAGLSNLKVTNTKTRKIISIIKKKYLRLSVCNLEAIYKVIVYNVIKIIQLNSFNNFLVTQSFHFACLRN